MLFGMVLVKKRKKRKSRVKGKIFIMIEIHGVCLQSIVRVVLNLSLELYVREACCQDYISI